MAGARARVRSSAALVTQTQEYNFCAGRAGTFPSHWELQPTPCYCSIQQGVVGVGRASVSVPDEESWCGSGGRGHDKIRQNTLARRWRKAHNIAIVGVMLSAYALLVKNGLSGRISMPVWYWLCDNQNTV